MVDEIRSNLEPIDEGDLDLRSKFENQKFSNRNSEEKLPSNDQESYVERRIEGGDEKDSAYARILSQIPKNNQNFNPSEVAKDAVSVNTGIDSESKVQNLVKLAESKGVFHAVKVAQHMNDNYALDEFHDRLLDEELHNALVKKGMIEEL